MTMIPTIVRADSQEVGQSKETILYKQQLSTPAIDTKTAKAVKDEMFLFEYEEGYDKNNRDHVTAFQNMEQIKNFNEQMLSTYGNASVEFDKNSMTIKLKMMAPFEKLANFMSMEFLACGSIGKMTLLDFVSIVASSFATGITKETSRDNRCMYV